MPLVGGETVESTDVVCEASAPINASTNVMSIERNKSGSACSSRSDRKWTGGVSRSSSCSHDRKPGVEDQLKDRRDQFGGEPWERGVDAFAP